MHPQLDVHNVPQEDIVGPTSYVWYTWSTDVKDARDKNTAKPSVHPRYVEGWRFDAEKRLSESGAPRYDIASINSQESAAALKAHRLTKSLQITCNQARKCNQPILSEKEAMSTLGQINGNNAGTQNSSTVIDTAVAAHKPIRVGTDCSGMESPIQALAGMKVPFYQVFACDKDPDSKKSIEANWKPVCLPRHHHEG